MEYRHVVTIKVTGTINGDAHHSELVLKPAIDFNGCLHHHKLRAKGSTFNAALLLGIPNNGQPINETDEASMRPACDVITSMVGIDKEADNDRLTSCLWSIQQDAFLDLTIKLLPFMLWERVMVDLRIGQIEGDSGIVMPFQITKDP